jgi:hypothetical protein
MDSARARGVTPGLCGSCLHVQRVTSSRGSKFYLCRRSLTDPHYARYPALPVVRCVGYELATPPPPAAAENS